MDKIMGFDLGNTTENLHRNWVTKVEKCNEELQNLNANQLDYGTEIESRLISYIDSNPGQEQYIETIQLENGDEMTCFNIIDESVLDAVLHDAVEYAKLIRLEGELRSKIGDTTLKRYLHHQLDKVADLVNILDEFEGKTVIKIGNLYMVHCRVDGITNLHFIPTGEVTQEHAEEIATYLNTYKEV